MPKFTEMIKEWITNYFKMDTPSNGAIRIIAINIAISLIAALVYPLHEMPNGSYAAVAMTGIVLIGASLLVGGLLGFLFGIPRALQQDRPQVEARYAENTNLEQVSDWLTKILVGVGLTQLLQIGEALKYYAPSFKSGFGGSDTAAAFGIALTIYMLVCGFFIGYIWARLYLPTAFSEANRNQRRIEDQRIEDQMLEHKRAFEQVNARLARIEESVLNPSRDGA